jgi:Zn finger protein HypA/HybF involved in hydrogenase expression
MTAYIFRISLDCPHCRAGVPVNGFTNEVLCNNCLQSIPLDQEWWEIHFDSETIEGALALEEGHANTSTNLGGLSEKIDAGNRTPRCQKCKTDLPDAIIQSGVTAGYCLCPKCQEHIRVRKATPLALSLIPEADLLLYEDEMGQGLGKDGHTAVEPVMFACLACGGGLKVDGSARTVKCDHCGGSNYLPDPLWLRLHPAATSHVFFVTRKVDAKPVALTAENLPKNMDSDKAVRILKDENLEPAVLRRIHELMEDEDDVLEALAKHRRTPDDLLIKLVDSDVYYQVRVAVAKRPNLSMRILEALSSDSDSDVKEALVKRPDLYELPQHVLQDILGSMDLDDLGKSIQNSKFPEWKLYDLADNCTPEDARRILRSPNVSKRVLRRLGSNPNSRADIKQHKIYQELGFFGKLFFFGGS